MGGRRRARLALVAPRTSPVRRPTRYATHRANVTPPPTMSEPIRAFTGAPEQA